MEAIKLFQYQKNYNNNYTYFYTVIGHAITDTAELIQITIDNIITNIHETLCPNPLKITRPTLNCSNTISPINLV